MWIVDAVCWNALCQVSGLQQLELTGHILIHSAQHCVNLEVCKVSQQIHGCWTSVLVLVQLLCSLFGLLML